MFLLWSTENLRGIWERSISCCERWSHTQVKNFVCHIWQFFLDLFWCVALFIEYCATGDHTLLAVEKAIKEVREEEKSRKEKQKRSRREEKKEEERSSREEKRRDGMRLEEQGREAVEEKKCIEFVLRTFTFSYIWWCSSRSLRRKQTTTLSFSSAMQTWVDTKSLRKISVRNPFPLAYFPRKTLTLPFCFSRKSFVEGFASFGVCDFHRFERCRSRAIQNSTATWKR